MVWKVLQYCPHLTNSGETRQLLDHVLLTPLIVTSSCKDSYNNIINFNLTLNSMLVVTYGFNCNIKIIECLGL